MSLKLGNRIDTDKVKGLHAVLIELPGANPDVDIINLPASNGGKLSYVGLNPAKFLFDLTIEKDSVEEALALATELSGIFYPTTGLQTLEFNPLVGWKYQVVQNRSLEWQRDSELWPHTVGGKGKAVMTARLELTAPDPHGYKADVALTGAITGAEKSKTLNFTRTEGNVPSSPVITFRGTVTGSQTVTVLLRDPAHPVAQRVVVRGPVNAGEELVLDFPNMEFYTRDANGTKTMNKADMFTNYSFIESGLGANTVTASTTGSMVSVDVNIEGKRI